MSRTAVEAEGSFNYNELYNAVRNSVLALHDTMGTTESIASSAVKTSIDAGAKLIIVCSESGNTARLIAKYVALEERSDEYCCFGASLLVVAPLLAVRQFAFL